MTGLDHITAGRTAIRTLLVAVVLTAALAGAVGTATTDAIDGKGNDVFVYDFPIDNATVVGFQVPSVADDTALTLIPSQDMDPY